jgi:hypothetical protein
MPKKKPPVQKQRGGLLTACLVLMMIHGIFAAFLVLYLRENSAQTSGASPAWVLLVLFALTATRIVAALAIWEWKRWGLVAYGVATLVSMVVGLILTHTQLWVFHELIPFVILGYVVKSRQQYFE